MTQKKLSPRSSTLALLCAALSTVSLLSHAVIPAEATVNAFVGEGPYHLRPLLQLLAKLRCVLTDAGLLGLVALVALVILYRHYFFLQAQGTFPQSKLFLALSALYGLLMLIGMSFQSFQSLVFLFQDKFQMLYTTVLWLGFILFFYVVSMFLVTWITHPRETSSPQSNRLTSFLLDKHPVLIPFCVLLLCWLPYWIACFPGSPAWDMNFQWGNYYGILAMSNHHPIAATLLYGAVLDLGRSVFSDLGALVLCAAFQYLLMAAGFTYGLCKLRQWNVSQPIRLLCLLYFALNPQIAIWSQHIIKDCAYMGVFFIFSVAYLDLIFKINHHQPTGKALLVVMVWGLLTGLMRNNGIYIVLLSLLLAVTVCQLRKQKAIVALSAVLTAVTITLVTNGLINLYGAHSGSVAEALSIPFQQTARYVRKYGNEVTQEERDAIDGVLDYGTLAEAYDPELSDPVKGTYKNDASKLLAYFLTWGKMLLKHPGVYFEATLNNSYGYLCPNAASYLVETEGTDMPVKILNGADQIFSPQARNACRNIVYTLRQTPGIGMLWSIGTYTWVLLFLIVLALYLKRYALIPACIPALLNLLVCIASPVNGLVRYALPHMLITPVILGWFFTELNCHSRRK